MTKFGDLLFSDIFASVRCCKSLAKFGDFLFSDIFASIRCWKSLAKFGDLRFSDIFALEDVVNLWQNLVIYFFPTSLLWKMLEIFDKIRWFARILCEAQIIQHNICVKICHVNVPLGCLLIGYLLGSKWNMKTRLHNGKIEILVYI